MIGEDTLPEPIFTLLRRTYAFKKTTDCDIHLDVYSSEAMGEISPAVVWIHGGALIMGSREAGQGHAARYVDAGYRVISISYRLAPETKLPEIIADVRDAFGWIRSNADELGIDPARIGAVGHSAGGYLALMIGHVRFKAQGPGVLLWIWRSDRFVVYKTVPVLPGAAAHRARRGDGADRAESDFGRQTSRHVLSVHAAAGHLADRGQRLRSCEVSRVFHPVLPRSERRCELSANAAATRDRRHRRSVRTVGAYAEPPEGGGRRPRDGHDRGRRPRIRRTLVGPPSESRLSERIGILGQPLELTESFRMTAKGLRYSYEASSTWKYGSERQRTWPGHLFYVWPGPTGSKRMYCPGS